MSDYPRIVIKKVEGEEIDALLLLPAPSYDLVMALEFSEDSDQDLSQGLGALSDLDADTLEGLVADGQAKAASLMIPFECLLDEDDYPEVDSES